MHIYRGNFFFSQRLRHSSRHEREQTNETSVFQMTTANEPADPTVHLPYSAIQALANRHQLPYLSDESIKYLTLEATGMIQFLLQVGKNQGSNVIVFSMV